MKNRKCLSCQEYQKRIETLEEELAFVKFELEELRKKRFKPKNKAKKQCYLGGINIIAAPAREWLLVRARKNYLKAILDLKQKH